MGLLRCPPEKYGFELDVVPFYYSMSKLDRTLWEANPAILTPASDYNKIELNLSIIFAVYFGWSSS